MSPQLLTVISVREDLSERLSQTSNAGPEPKQPNTGDLCAGAKPWRCLGEPQDAPESPIKQAQIEPTAWPVIPPAGTTKQAIEESLPMSSFPRDIRVHS